MVMQKAQMMVVKGEVVVADTKGDDLVVEGEVVVADTKGVDLVVMRADEGASVVTVATGQLCTQCLRCWTYWERSPSYETRLPYHCRRGFHL